MSATDTVRGMRSLITQARRGVLTDSEVANHVCHCVLDVIGTIDNPDFEIDLPEAAWIREQCRKTAIETSKGEPGLRVLLLTAIDDGIDGIRRRHRLWRRTSDALTDLQRALPSRPRSEDLATLALLAVAARDDRLAEEVARSAALLDEREVLELIAREAQVLGQPGHAVGFASRALSGITPDET